MAPSRRNKIPVAVLGATGMVGQRLALLLSDHPWFELVELTASTRSAGHRYADVVPWRLERPLPGAIGALTVRETSVADVRAPLVFSALDASVAREIERPLAAAGHLVVSNASAHRMDDDVPLVVPEVNPDHLGLLGAQQRGGDGGLVTNPNCSTIGLVLGLAPLHRAAGVRRVVLSTLQAASGAGYPGVSSIDLVDNVVPGIPGEEEKIEAEPRKIFGSLDDSGAGGVIEAGIEVSSHTHRVPVIDGHLMAISVETDEGLSVARATELMASFRGEPQERGLPSAPSSLIEVVSAPDRPQPRLDRDAGGGMSVTVGRLRPCPVLGLRFELLSHNTWRGAAGGTVLIAETLVARGCLP
ncbi:MAG: aspartate-semialdehyde dehydrogenase [Acidobacteriota bacterium]|nr:MAG: aspartate-semialdehyde dehydrogenase [Acidobacteriota bacterium]